MYIKHPMGAQRQFAVNQAVKYIKAFYGPWAHSLYHPFALVSLLHS